MNQLEGSLDAGAVRLREHLSVLRLQKLSILLIAALVLASALFFSMLRMPIYASEARVLVKGAALQPGQAQSEAPANLETERGLARSEGVARIVADALGVRDSQDALLEGLTVGIETNTEILVFRYAHPQPETAQRRAQAFAEAYLTYRRAQLVDDMLASSRSIQQRLEAVGKQLQSVQGEIAAEPDKSREVALQAQANSLISQSAVLQQKLSELTTPEQLRVGQIVESADRPRRPAAPNHLLNAGLGLLGGLALGVGVAFLRERLDDRLRGRNDLEVHAAAPVLAVIPRIDNAPREEPGWLVARGQPHSGASEAYRTLRTGLLFSASQRGTKTIIVTSANEGEGKTLTTANLGVALAQAGKQVVLISADLRKPRLHRLFSLFNGVGLSDVLSGRAAARDGLQAAKADNLRVLPSGPVPSAPTEMLASEAMGKLLGELRETADFVLLDAPPILPIADAVALASRVDAVLMVADAEHTTRSAISHARQQLDQVNGQVIGAVLNNFDPAKARLYHAYYGYYDQRYEHRPEMAPSAPASLRPDASGTFPSSRAALATSAATGDKSAVQRAGSPQTSARSTDGLDATRSEGSDGAEIQRGLAEHSPPPPPDTGTEASRWSEWTRPS